MRYLIICLVGFCSLSVFAQEPDPELFQDWNLYYFQANDMKTEFIIGEIDPPISPTLSLTKNYDFSGDAACNSFSGTFANIVLDVLVFNLENQTTNDCGVSIHNSFEDDYISYFNNPELFYTIQDDGTGLNLDLSSPLFGIAKFKNYKLSSSDFLFRNTTLYPNPVTSVLHIDSDLQIIKIEVYSITGNLVKTETVSTTEIILSDLTSGLYFVKLYSDHGSELRKIIKN